jgi:hypothetical protein
MLHDKLERLIYLFVRNPKVSVLHRLAVVVGLVDPRPMLVRSTAVKLIVVVSLGIY